MLELADAAGATRPDLAPATVSVLLAPAEVAGALAIAVLAAGFEGEPQRFELTLEPPPGWSERQLEIRLDLELSDDVDRVAVGVAAAGGELWGAAEAEWGEPDWPAEGTLRITRNLRPAAAPVEAAPVLRLLPPRQAPVRGPTRVRVLVSEPAIERVVFELDGQPVAEETEPPFTALIDFGEGDRPRVLRAVAFVAGSEAGEDRITVNETAIERRVRITGVDPANGRLRVTASLELPAEDRAEGLDFYFNDRLLVARAEPPWQAELPVATAGPRDFVRVVARLADGSTIEDARLAAGGSSERIEVNLVQVFAVVTDRSGEPQLGLTRDRFALRLAGRPVELQRFAPATEVSLVLGVVIDTSGSMWSLMPDTQRAGSQFLASTLRPGDRAFLVDFDTRPRLAAPTTGDVELLLRRFAGLEADGFTALYDAVIFSMLQFEQEPGRKALVVLTDGDDYRSRFTSKRCIRYGRELGVPVYIIALGGLYGERRDVRRLPLEALARSTGGRVFHITGIEQLADAYARIEQELRSQYLLAFSTERPLTGAELAEVKVEISGRGLEVRSVAGVARR